MPRQSRFTGRSVLEVCVSLLGLTNYTPARSVVNSQCKTTSSSRPTSKSSPDRNLASNSEPERTLGISSWQPFARNPLAYRRANRSIPSRCYWTKWTDMWKSTASPGASSRSAITCPNVMPDTPTKYRRNFSFHLRPRDCRYRTDSLDAPDVTRDQRRYKSRATSLPAHPNLTS